MNPRGAEGDGEEAPGLTLGAQGDGEEALDLTLGGMARRRLA